MLCISLTTEFSLSLERIVQAATKALDALKRMKAKRNASSHTERKRVKQEMSNLFCSRRPRTLKKCAWQHKFYCLAYTDQDKSPTCEALKDELFRAGLGEKEISFEDSNISQEEFHDIILNHYPRLQEGGGFRFLKGDIVGFVYRITSKFGDLAISIGIAKIKIRQY